MTIAPPSAPPGRPSGAAGMPGARRRPGALVLVPLAAVVVALGVAAVNLVAPAPSPGPSSGLAALPPPVSPLLVDVDRAGSGPAAVGYPVLISASALGLTGVAGLELWVGGERVEVAENRDPNRPAATARWEWIPQATGETIIVARAFDAAGRTAQSAALRLTIVAEPPRSFRLATVPALEGETLDALVARVGGDVELARSLNPDLASGPLAEGVEVPVPIYETGVAPAAAREPAGVRELDDARPASALGAVVPAGLATPNLVASVDDCTVTATASNGGPSSGGLAFAALPPVGDTFLALPPIAADADGGGSTSFLALGGTNYLTVASYSDEVMAPSAIVPVEVPSECGSAGWEGDAHLEAGKLIVPGTADKTYLYLKIGEGQWQRVPGPAGTFVTPLDGVFDFGAQLPELAGFDLEIEAWGWSGGALTKLGAGSYTAPSQQLYSGGLVFGGGDPLLGIGTTLDIVVIPGGGEILEQLTKHSSVDLPGPNSTSGKRSFKWSTTVPGVTHLVWQVLPYPLGTTSLSLTPPFLIDSGTVAVQNLTSGYFSLDLKAYLLDNTGSAGVWSTTLMGEELINQLVLSNPYIPGATTAPGEVFIDPGNLWWPKPSGGGSVTQGPPALDQAALEDLSYLIPPPSTLFVRVIPFVGSIPLPQASNAVSFDVVEPSDPVYIDTTPPPPPPTYPGAYTMEAKFFGPTGSNSTYARCVRVVSGGKTVYEPLYTIYGGSNWNNGTVHCQPPPDDDDGWSLSDAFETFAGWVGDVWDFVSEGYTWMQDQIVAAILAVVPCEQLASQATSNGKEICEKIAHTALQAALASFGLPPEIPDWESTISAAKGDLKTFILENAEALPGVGEACAAAALANQGSSSVPTCDEVVDEAVDAAIDQIVAERSKAAAYNAGVIVPPGITVEPDPRSMAQPPHFEVKLTRTNLPLPGDVVCTLYGSMKSVVQNWTWKEYQWKDGNATVVTKGPAEVNGEPFMSVKQVVAPMPPGASAAYELWLTKRVIWFEPDGWNDHYAEQYAEWNGSHNHAWVLLQKGATVTASLSSNCTTGGDVSTVLTGQAWN